MQSVNSRALHGAFGRLLLSGSMFLLGSGVATAAPTPFVCSNNFYIVQGSAASVTLNTINIGTKTLTPIGASTSTLYNGIGFRPQDGFIWGSNGATANTIVQVDATGTLAVLPLTGGITLTNSGDINPVTGLYYNGGGGNTTLNEINVAAAPNPALLRTLTLSQRIGFDMAFSPLSGNAYTVYQGRLYSFAIPASGTAVTVNGPVLTTGVTLPAGDTYGAAFFDQNGIFYPYDNKGTLYRIDVNASPATVSIAASGLPSVANNDGAWCAAAPNMTKDANPRALAPGGITTYTFKINNILAATNVTFNDTLPAGLTFVPGTISPATIAGGTPALSGGNATLTIPGMTLAGTTSYTFTIQAQASLAANGDYPNQANLTGTIYGGNAQVSAISSDPTLLAPYQPTVVSVAVPSLGIAKTSNGPWTVGQAGATYTLTVTNTGTAATAGTVTVLDTLPTGITVAAGTYNGWTCTAAVSCTNSTAIPSAGGTSTITLPVTVAAAAAGSITNNASVGGGGDPNNGGAAPAPGSCVGGDPHCASTTTAVNLPQLTVTKSANPASFTVGGTGTYSLTVGNAGTSNTAGNITISDALPSGITTTATPSGAGWNCSASTLTNVSCTTAAAVAVGASAPVISVPVAIAIGTASPVVNTAAVSGGGDTTCPGSAHCFAQISTTVNAPKLQVTKTATPNPFVVGQSASYTITVTNNGTAATVATTTVTDAIPAGLTIGALTGTCSAAVQNVTCTIPSGMGTGAGNAVTFTIPVTVTAGAANGNNTAIATGGGDPNCTGSNCSGTVIVPVNTPANLTLNKAGPATVQANGTLAYTIGLGNSGQTASGTTATVQDVLPTGVTYVSAAPGAGVSAVTCTPAGQTLTCTVTLSSALAAGAANGTAAFTINTTAPSTGGNITNYAAVDPTGGTNPPTPGAACAPATSCGSATTTVLVAPTVAKVFSPVTIAPNGTSTLTITLSNANATAVTGAAFTDTLPGGMTTQAATAATTCVPGTAGQTAGTVTLAGATIPANGSCNVTVTVTASSPGGYTNTIAAGGVTTTNAGSNAASTSATLTVIAPHLKMTKSASPNPFIVGQSAQYLIQVDNTGTAATSGNIVVTDTLPSGISYVS
ncbi:MAG: DUF11 domain-containing protein, partial [Proteobacteria bacterium]|nr:DUF11 domain-containing protein [Pseudomonadota bacterium]